MHGEQPARATVHVCGILDRRFAARLPRSAALDLTLRGDAILVRRATTARRPVENTPLAGDTSAVTWALLDTLRALWRDPHVSRDEIEAFRVRRLGALLAHAATDVPHYRDRFAAAGISGTRVRETADLARFPITSKADLRAAPLAATLAAGTRPERLVRRLTSGSTGEPFVIRRAPLEDHLLQLFRVRAWRQLGMRAGDRRVSVAEAPLDGRRGGWPGPLRAWAGLYGNQYLDGLRAGPELLDRLERLCPEVISGYPSTLEQVAQLLDASHRRRIRPRLLLAGGEVLRPASRRTIEQAFRAPLFDLYGAHEFNLLAWQCPAGAGTLHVCDDGLVLEVLDEDGTPVAEGESGEVVATNLHAFAMPFIRYRTGDRAVRGPATCPCGQPFTTLLAIDGRTMDHVVLPDGRRVHPFLLTGPLLEHEAGWIAQHQLEQRTRDTLVLRLKPRGAANVEGVARLHALGARIVGPDVRLTIEVVDGFATPHGRKFPPYVALSPSAGTTACSAIEPGRNARASGPAEHATAPRLLLVHDPSRVGALDALDDVADASLEETILFRSRPDAAAYAAQHAAFVATLRAHAGPVVYLTDLLDGDEFLAMAGTSPNLVFTRDSLVTLPWLGDVYVKGRMARAVRQGEPEVLRAAVETLGLRELLAVPDDLVLEGGDVVPFAHHGRRVLLVGYGNRTQLATVRFLAEALVPAHADEVVGIRLAPWRINLDGGLLPVADDVVVCHRESILEGRLLDARGERPIDVLAWLEHELGFRIVAATLDESVYGQACNAVCLGGRRIVYYDLNPRVAELLRQHDVEALLTPGSELVKGRGGPRCMTRPIYGAPRRPS